MRLWPLFLVSMATVAYETALPRYFAVATWSEYGYWVISIVMAGFAVSGVVLALWREMFLRRGNVLIAILPALLVISAALGFYLTTINPFNALQFQNPTTWTSQLWNIAGYYGALLPYFFLAGLFVGLNFILNAKRIGKVYGYDLIGAGIGAGAILALMFVVHAFFLIPLLLVPLAASTLFLDRKYRWRSATAAGLALLVSGSLLVFHNQAHVNEFKAIFAPEHTPNAHVVGDVLSPRGDYILLNDFMERVDTDVSNNAGLLHVDGPPRSLGLYRDGSRIAALPLPSGLQANYATSALDALPYMLVPHAHALLVGASGGFRLAELLTLGVVEIHALEPEPVLHRALLHGLGPSPPFQGHAGVSISDNNPLAAAGDERRWDVIDISSDFLDAAPTNVSAYSAEAIRRYIRALKPDGIISIPISVREFPVYALRALATARVALQQAGIEDPASHIVMYRSAWNVRLLISRDPWSDARISTVRKFCDDRSFDVSWYPGIDVHEMRARLYNDLPAVSFTTGAVTSGSPDDAIADEAGAVLADGPTASRESFNLNALTLDRPFYYAVLRLNQLSALLRRLEILPQQEIAVLVNIAVLAQAAVIALIVLLVPLLAPRRFRSERPRLWRPAVYFPALGLGFLYIQIALIERASFWLDDKMTGFALVLTAMLVFSGIGSMAADRLAAASHKVMAGAALVVSGWCGVAIFGLQPMMIATLSWPWLARAALIVTFLAPVSLGLGFPFPLGLARLADGRALPWAWALNGAFSVVATPSANLLARGVGIDGVLLGAAILYALAVLTFPAVRKRTAWQDMSTVSHAAK